MKVIRTSDIDVLETWLIGGQIDASGNYSEGFNSFYAENYDEIKKDGYFNYDVVEQLILDLIMEYGDSPSNSIHNSFFYWDDYYKFKTPKKEKLRRLVMRILKELTKREVESESN